MNEITKELESILTIDGIGRPAKARKLLSLLQLVSESGIEIELREMSKRKFL
jgi:hypothetical protein